MSLFENISLSTLKKAFLLAGFFYGVLAYGQNQREADSLEQLYTTGQFEDADRLQILGKLAYNHPDPDKALQFSEELLKLATSLDSSSYIIKGYLQKGNALRLKGDVSESLQSYFKGVQIATDEGQNKELGKLYICIADVYSVMGNRQNTVLYYTNAISILKTENDSLNYASAIENLGDEYNLNFAKPDSALILFEESGAIFKALKNETGMAYNLGNKGLAYAQKGNVNAAEKNIAQAIDMLTVLGDYYPICVYLTYLSDIYAEKGDDELAFTYAEQSLKLALQYGLKDQISNAFQKLSALYEKNGDTKEALSFYKSYITYKDSVRNISIAQELGNLRTDHAISQKQVEVDLLNQQGKNQRIISYATVITAFLIGLLALGLYRRNRFIKRTNNIIALERDRSDNLLLNILPEETAMELKEKGKVSAKRFESVTVLFTDFQGFTNYSQHLSPEELVASVDFYYSKFDQIMEKYDLEKIKTVGDAYMCAGGLPYPTTDHAFKMLQAAFEIKEFVDEAKLEMEKEGTRFDIRIGLNTGPVVAGVVGTKKFAYDIWGDTVNVASRMESLSEPGRINISEDTFEIVKERFDCEPRGEIFVKNKGMMKMYFVNGIQ